MNTEVKKQINKITFLRDLLEEETANFDKMNAETLIEKSIFRGKVKKIGGGYFILIPKLVREDLNVKELDLLELSIIKVNPVEKDYHCSNCGNNFLSSETYPECELCIDINKDQLNEKEDLNNGRNDSN